MLELLHIENIAIIETAEITFKPGFNVLTGETGAGKSIVIDSLSAVLGQRTSRDLIRTGAAKAFVSATFTAVPADLQPEEDGTLILQREIFTDGKNVCRVNGRPISVTQLKNIGNRLLNIHGQHDGQQLLDEDLHGEYLDNFGRLQPQRAHYAQAYAAMAALEQKIRSLQMDEAEKARRVDTLRYQIQELEKAKLKAGEEETLLARRNVLQNGEKYISAVNGADFCLNGDESSSGALALLRQAQEALAGVKNLDESFAALWQRLDALYSDVYDVADTVRDQKEQFDFSPAELDDVEGRLDQLYRLKKKYGATVEDMLDYLERCRRELDEFEFADDSLAHLTKELESAKQEALTRAQALTQMRRQAADELQARILAELQQLNMGKIQFCIGITPKPMDSSGADEVRFLMSANLGEDLKPLQKIASGGELARIMLAMKTVLSEQDEVGTMVFDEVDTGVSGRAAQKVAEKMAQLSRARQVLCVTHLPQLSAMADTHFSVEKEEAGGRTYTRVRLLDEAGRVQELARLSGGDYISEAMLGGAQELLGQAERFKKQLRS